MGGEVESGEELVGGAVPSGMPRPVDRRYEGVFFGSCESVLTVHPTRYPPKMIPGVDIIIHTTATNDRDARLLLSGTGLPFYGKHRN